MQVLSLPVTDSGTPSQQSGSPGHVRVGGAGTIFFEKHLSSPAKSKNASVLFVPDSRSSHTSGHKKYSIFDFSVEPRMFFFRRWMPCCRLQIERAGRLFYCPPSKFHTIPCRYANPAHQNSTPSRANMPGSSIRIPHPPLPVCQVRKDVERTSFP